MSLTPAQVECLRAIADGRGQICLKGYRFNSADVLWRHGLIYGQTDVPFWMWRLTGKGRWALKQAEIN